MIIHHSLELLKELAHIEQEIQKMEQMLEQLGMSGEEDLLKKAIYQKLCKMGQSKSTGPNRN